jgi:hypothetical protein
MARWRWVHSAVHVCAGDARFQSRGEHRQRQRSSARLTANLVFPWVASAYLWQEARL